MSKMVSLFVSLFLTVSFLSLLVTIATSCNDNASPTAAASSANMTIKGGLSSPTSDPTSDVIDVIDGNVQKATIGINPSSWKMKIYKVGFSTSANCSNPTSFTVASPDYVDFSSTPTLVNGALADGTYNCVIIEFASMVKFVPATSTDNGLCIAGTEVEMDVCRTGSSSTLIDGTVTNCTSNNSDRIALYMAIGGDCSNSQGQDNCGFVANVPTALQTALTVRGTSTGTFYARANGLIGEYNTGDVGAAECGMDEPQWGFE